MAAVTPAEVPYVAIVADAGGQPASSEGVMGNVATATMVIPAGTSKSQDLDDPKSDLGLLQPKTAAVETTKVLVAEVEAAAPARSSFAAAVPAPVAVVAQAGDVGSAAAAATGVVNDVDGEDEGPLPLAATMTVAAPKPAAPPAPAVVSAAVPVVNADFVEGTVWQLVMNVQVCV